MNIYYLAVITEAGSKVSEAMHADLSYGQNVYFIEYDWARSEQKACVLPVGKHELPVQQVEKVLPI